MSDPSVCGHRKCVNEVMRWSGIARMGRIVVMTAWELGNNTLNYLASADPKQIAATFIICTDGMETGDTEIQPAAPSQPLSQSCFLRRLSLFPEPSSAWLPGPQSEAPHGHLLNLSKTFRG